MARKSPHILGLRRAALHIQAYMDSLDLSKTTCACCHTDRYNNWSDVQAHEAMKAALNRIERQIERLEAGVTQGDMSS